MLLICPTFRYTTHYTARIDYDQDLFIYIHTYIYMFFLRVVIWETLRACYFHSTCLSLTWFLLFTKALRFKRWKLGSPKTCSLMVSSLRLSVCSIYDKRAWVIYCSLSWQWYIFETSNLSDRIDFIMFPVANEKQRLSVVLITRRFFQHPFTACFCFKLSEALNTDMRCVAFR